MDWALDVAVPAQRKAAEKLIALLLAPAVPKEGQSLFRNR